MKGSVRKRGNSWYIIFDLGTDESGRRKQKWEPVPGTRKDAERELARVLHSLNIGAYVEPSTLTVKEYLERWLADYARGAVGDKTFERYAEIVRRHLVPALGTIRLCRLKPGDLQSFYRRALESGRIDGSGGLSAQTVLHFHRLLHAALDQAVRWELISRNPADSVDPPRARRPEVRALSAEEIAALLSYLEGSALYLPTFMALATGMRRGELLALRWEDVDLSAGTAMVRRSLSATRQGTAFKSPKSRQGRLIGMPPVLVEELRRHREHQQQHQQVLGEAYEDQGLILAGPTGQPLHPDRFSKRFELAVRRSGLKHLRFHDLRHTLATQLLMQDVHPKVVAEQLGHSKIGITLDTYSHVVPRMQTEAVGRLDSILRKRPDNPS